MADPYAVLGVARDASEDAIRKAYRRLAKQLHPDLNPGDKAAEEKFKAASGAYALLSDAAQRAKFDRGEIDAEGNQRAPERPYWRDYAEADEAARYRPDGGLDEADIEDLMAQAFGRGRRRGPRKGADLRYALSVPFLDAARGVKQRVTLPDGRSLDIGIPAGVEDGQVLRLRGEGLPGAEGAPAGDALVTVSVLPDARFRREGDDILLDLPVTLKEAVLGARVAVPTIGGEVMLGIPPQSQNGARLRLRGRGIREGHQFVVLRVVLPGGEEPELAAFLRDWTPRDGSDPRAGPEGA